MGEPVIVELTGVCGIGKTRLAAAIVETSTDQGLAVRMTHTPGGWWGRAVKELSLLGELPRVLAGRGEREAIAIGFRNIRRSGNAFLVKLNLARNLVRRLAVLSKLRRTGAGEVDVWLCDEGSVHGVYNAFVHSDPPPDRSDLARFLDVVPKPDWVVSIHPGAADIAEWKAGASVTWNSFLGVARIGRGRRREAFLVHSLEVMEAVERHPRVAERLLVRVDWHLPSDAEIRARADAIRGLLGAAG